MKGTHIIEGIDWEFGSPVMEVSIEKDLKGRLTFIASIFRRTQFSDWSHTILFTARIGKPWLTLYHGLLYDGD